MEMEIVRDAVRTHAVVTNSERWLVADLEDLKHQDE
jgi:hypothetical protein